MIAEHCNKCERVGEGKQQGDGCWVPNTLSRRDPFQHSLSLWEDYQLYKLSALKEPEESLEDQKTEKHL